jgi:sugar phosphate isomerase/epimerase
MNDSLREWAEYGQKFGVIVAVQNHGDFVNTGGQHVSLIKRVNHEWCAALVDTGKYLTANPYEDIALAAPYAVNWQIKETRGSTMDSPLVDIVGTCYRTCQVVDGSLLEDKIRYAKFK